MILLIELNKLYNYRKVLGPTVKSPEGLKVAKVAIEMKIELDDSWSIWVSIDSA